MNKRLLNEQLFNEVEEALQGIGRYHLRMEMDDEFVSEGDVDVEEKAIYLTVRVEGEPPREAEVYWIGEKAYGLPHHVGTWFQVSVPGEPVSYLHAIAGILQTGEVTTVREENLADERCWVFSVTPDLSHLRENAEEFANASFPQLSEGSEKEKQILATVKQAVTEMEMQAEFWISKETHYIKKAILKTLVSDAETQTTYHISDVNDPELQISPPAEALEAEGPPVPSLGALFMKFTAWESHSSYWGWSENNHCMMTDESLQLIKDNDPDGKYQEIYYGYPDHWNTTDWSAVDWSIVGGPTYYTPKALPDSEPGLKDPPCVVGTWSEDAWDAPRTRDLLDPSAMTVKTYRSFRHFGGTYTGLKWGWYFKFVDSIPKPPGGYYPSARDWGLHGAKSGDKMNFRGAIDVYNHYTYAGTKEAYRRMGHVLHLLQDIAQPDHAGLSDHAASAMTEPEAYKRFEVCKWVKIEAVILAAGHCNIWCAGPWYLICYPGCVGIKVAAAEIACKASIDDDEVGFEYLIREKWDFNRKDVTGNLRIETEKSTPYQPDPYYNYFSNMQKYSLYEAKSRNLSFPLGLGKIPFPPYIFVPGLDPDIKYPGEEKPFLELADKVIAKATNMSAGLLQHFYEVVNHPPYVQEVVVVQEEIKMEVDEVTGKLFPADPDKRPNLNNVKYQAWWVCHYDDPSKLAKKLQFRELNVVKSEPLDSTPWTYVVARVTSNMKQLTLTLKNAKGVAIYQDQMEEVASTLTKDYNARDHPASCCDFPPTAYYIAVIRTDDLRIGKAPLYCGDLTLAFAGEDLEPHFSYPVFWRKHSGKELDSNPGTVAVADTAFPHNWINDPLSPTGFQRAYEPGTDENHRIKVILHDVYEPNDDYATATTIKINPGESRIDNLSLHDSSDRDYFCLQVPVNPKCKGALNPNISHFFNIMSSWLQICVKPEWPLEGVIITFFLKNGMSQQYTFNTGDVCPESPLLAESAAFFGIEDWFPDGNVRFLVEAKPDKSGKKQRGCYSMTIKYGKCRIKKGFPDQP